MRDGNELLGAIPCPQNSFDESQTRRWLLTSISIYQPHPLHRTIFYSNFGTGRNKNTIPLPSHFVRHNFLGQHIGMAYSAYGVIAATVPKMLLYQNIIFFVCSFGLVVCVLSEAPE